MKALSVILVLFLSGCTGFFTGPCECRKGPCTMEFRTIMMTLQDKNEQPYLLDDYQTRRLSTGAIVSTRAQYDTWSDSMFRAEGRYPVLDDGFTNRLDRCGEEFEFTGYKNSTVVFSRKFKIRSDCCHVDVMAGILTATID